jgi:UDP-2-acetamido-2-deoxy-ribo-hexuluronate aminotransferase
MVPNREALQKRLAEAGIPTVVHYPVPLNEQPAYKHLCCPDCTPIAQQIAKQVMSLPMSPDLSADDQDKVVSAILA